MDRVAVVGGGTMGAGIAEVCARAGCDVVVLETGIPAVEAATKRLTTSLAKGVRAQRLTQDEANAALARVRLTTDLEDLADPDLVLEAAPEVEELKLALFARLDAALPAGTVLASNTSSIPLVRIARATTRPERVVGVHFFNPVPVLPLVEIVPSLLTGADTVAAVTRFAEQRLGKQTIRSGDRAGFVVNALLVPYLLSAVRMLEAGFASAEDIDAGMVAGCAHPLGPLALADLIGLDTTAAIADSLYAEFREPQYAAPPLLRRLVEAGRLGRKSGQGFFPYPG